MSRSRRLAVIKDAPRNGKKSTMYWRTIRRRLNQKVREGVEDLPNPRTIVNDYDYSDYTFKVEYYRTGKYQHRPSGDEELKEDKIKLRRK